MKKRDPFTRDGQVPRPTGETYTEYFHADSGEKYVRRHELMAVMVRQVNIIEARALDDKLKRREAYWFVRAYRWIQRYLADSARAPIPAEVEKLEQEDMAKLAEERAAEMATAFDIAEKVSAPTIPKIEIPR